ncbi:MAG: M48 family metalloprotease [Gammaproteobacteria bacterium]|nr:M48 family metalloprotease [Gammaproteobacteria bacterium]
MSNFTEEQFVELVKKSEQDAANSIGAYKVRLGLFALLGYAVIFGVLVALLALIGGTIGIALVSTSLALLLVKKKIIFIILIAIWTFLKALWVRFDAPVGHELKREQFPGLFREIDDLTKRLDALKIHQVIINEDLNASVVQHPRWGLLGGQINTLFLGLQLLLALSPQEMRSVLAHEIGHLSGNHSRFSGWIYRVRITWQRIMLAFEDSHSFGAILMRKFFDWYAPKFSAYSFALARSNEYEADQVAAELTSSATAAKALANVYAKVPYINSEYWDVYFDKADLEPKPPNPPYEGLASFLKESPVSREQLIELINKELEVETHYADTHPALRDRIQAITDTAVVPDSFDKSAAEAWLGDHYSDTLEHFDQRWYQQNQQRWQDRYDYVTKSKKKLETARNQDIDSLDDDDLWNLAELTSEFEDDDAALALYLRFYDKHPDSIGTAYHIGRILIDRKDEAALPFLKKAFTSPHTLEYAAKWGYSFLIDEGKEEEAESWWEEAAKADEIHRLTQQERNNVTQKDDFEAPQISEELLTDLQQQISSQKNVGSVWIAQKILVHSTGDPVYVICFRPKGLYWSSSKVLQKLLDKINVNVDLYVVSLFGESKKLGKKVKKVGQKIL